MDRQRRTRQASSEQTPASSEQLQIRYRDIGELIPYAMNSRTHSEAQVAQIAGSIRQFGWTNPVLLDGDSGIIAGHGRVMAARMLGIRDIPTIELRHLSETQRRAYVIADNQLALLAGWDESVLALEMKALQIEDFDLGLTGFDQAEIDRLLDGAGPSDVQSPDAFPEVDENIETDHKCPSCGYEWSGGKA
jgi:ParB-like chromosome segregation protein Spo0J